MTWSTPRQVAAPVSSIGRLARPGRLEKKSIRKDHGGRKVTPSVHQRATVQCVRNALTLQCRVFWCKRKQSNKNCAVTAKVAPATARTAPTGVGCGLRRAGTWRSRRGGARFRQAFVQNYFVVVVRSARCRRDAVVSAHVECSLARCGDHWRSASQFPIAFL